MEQIRQKTDYFGTEKIGKILFRLAPPVMLAQLIQALYNIIDSVFVGKYSDNGLTALSIVYPLQLLMIALAVGTGVGTPLAVVLWALFAGICYMIMPAYARMQTDSPEIIANVITYGRTVCVLSIGLFLEKVCVYLLNLLPQFPGAVLIALQQIAVATAIQDVEFVLGGHVGRHQRQEIHIKQGALRAQNVVAMLIGHEITVIQQVDHASGTTDTLVTLYLALYLGNLVLQHFLASGLVAGVAGGYGVEYLCHMNMHLRTTKII